MESFFVYDRLLPSGAGFPYFGAWHNSWLAAAVIVTALLCSSHRSAGERRAAALRITVAALILGCELLRTVELLRTGIYDVYSLPLHLCGISVFLTAWHAVGLSKRWDAELVLATVGDRRQVSVLEYVGEFLYAVSMPGAAAALIIPDWRGYPALNLLGINSFAVHILLTAYPLMIVTRGELHPKPIRLLYVAAALLVIAVPVYGINKLTGANFMYLNRPAPGSPLVYFEGLWGNPGYVLGFVPLLAVIWMSLYLPPLWFRRRRF